MNILPLGLRRWLTGNRVRLALVGGGAAASLVAGCDSLVTRPSLYGRVYAIVTQRDGTPIPNVQLVLYTGERRMGYGVSDSVGFHRFDYVPDGRYGVFTQVPAGYSRLEYLIDTPRTDFADQLRVTPGGEPPLARLTLLKVGTGTVTVLVTEPSGVPIADVPVSLYSGAAGTLKSGRTDALGRFVFSGAPFGNVGVAATRPSPYLDSADAPLAYRDGIVVDAGSFETARVTIAPCAGGISVTVQDDAGGVVPSARVRLYTGSGALDSALTDSSGGARFSGLPCGNFGVNVASTPLEWIYSLTRGNGFVDGIFTRRNVAKPVVLRVQRVPACGTLSIAATDNLGAPVAGALALLYTHGGVWRSLVTGADGTATFSQIPCTPDAREWGVELVQAPATHTITPGRGTSFHDGIRFAPGVPVNRAFVLVRK